MKKGFTLVELAIVLVIIGLLIGGILVARSMVSNSRNLRLVSEINQINITARLFKERYNCLPGDCANGTALGLVTSGDGNGYVGINGGCVGGDGERFWQHLKATALYPTNMPSAATPTGCSTVTYDMPYSSYSKNTRYTFTAENYHNEGNRILFCDDVMCDSNNSKAIDAVNALAVDTKFDDGLPFSGKIEIMVNYGAPIANCSSNASGSGPYRTQNTYTCALSFYDFDTTY